MSNLLLIFIILNTYLGIFVLSALATIILYLLSFIKFNKYDPSQFIHYKNAYVQSSKIKDAFYQAHPEYFRVC
jgi:hypothetical protein